MTVVRQLLPDSHLLRTSAVQFGGNATARFLSLLFSLAAARMLGPSEFGRLAFGIAVASSVSILVSNAPRGLSRFLARHHDDRALQDAYFSNWLFIVALAFVANLVLLVPVASFLHVSGWLLVGVAANIVGIGVLQTYSQAHRGLGHFGAMALYYMLANLLQLLVILGLGLSGKRSAALFLTVYGLSSVAALLVQVVTPLDLAPSRSLIDRARIVRILRFIRPLAFQTVFYSVWSNADVIMVGLLLGSAATGNYGAARTLVSALYLVPLAVSTVAGQRVVLLQGARLRSFVVSVVGLTAIASLLGSAVLVIFGHPIVHLVYGDKYSAAVPPLPLLAIGMTLYGLELILEGIWVGLGNPGITAITSGIAMVVTLGTGPFLIGTLGITGAALAYALGAGAQLLAMAAFTIRSMMGDRIEAANRGFDENEI